jgi:hypothetical protein
VFSFNVDLGQVVIGGLIAIVGWLVKREITDVGVRLDRHENIISDLVGKMQNVIGYNQAMREMSDRRKLPRSE